MQKIEFLEDLAGVRLGVAFKTAVMDLEGQGTSYLIQTKDITLDGNIDMNGLARVETDPSAQKHFLQTGDILLRLRGPVFSAAIYDGKLSMPVFVTNQTAVIRCNKEHVSPYYLQWFINSSLGQHYLKKGGEGTSITKISSKTVSKMPLQLPSREKQTQIEVIHKNWLAQKELHRILIDNGELYYSQLCLKIQKDGFQ